VTLPPATGRSFWLNGSALQYPDFDNAETFVTRLANSGILARDPIVYDTLLHRPRNLSMRSAQRHFLRSTGVTFTTFRQIERARYATNLLREGISILDVVSRLDYFDQAHLTRSLRRFIGQTPTQIAQHQKQLSFLYKTNSSPETIVSPRSGAFEECAPRSIRRRKEREIYGSIRCSCNFQCTTLGGPHHERFRSTIPSVGWSNEAREACRGCESNSRPGISGVRHCRHRRLPLGMHAVVCISSHLNPRSDLADWIPRWRNRESGSRSSELVQCDLRLRVRLPRMGRLVVARRSCSRLPANIMTALFRTHRLAHSAILPRADILTLEHPLLSKSQSGKSCHPQTRWSA
jgi:AraC-like DNA-binding protein